ncbi:MAG: GTPase RsgA [Acidobacteriia bacterium]|nr:GTPase RsgA [Terriglobia bacterium]
MNYSSDYLVRARVCEAAQEHYCLRFEDGAECDAVPAGVLRWSAELPAVGDWVLARRADATLALIENVEPRTTCISRQRPGGGGEQVLAANVDLIAIVMGLDGDYNLRRLERYLVLAAASGAEAMVALNKMDVCAEWSARLANALLGESRQATQPVRESDSRGRHTTTRRMLIELPDGGALIDTPGLRELALWAGQDSVDDVFADIAALARQCRFHDCAHEGEPGCAVSAALKTGELEPARWASYQKLLAEARYHERSVDQRATAETKRKWKAIHKAMRHHPKYNR